MTKQECTIWIERYMPFLVSSKDEKKMVYPFSSAHAHSKVIHHMGEKLYELLKQIETKNEK